MHIIRFEDVDGRVLLGEDRGNGAATLLLDPDGVLGPTQADQARRELLRGRRALVADDDEGVRQAIGATLQRLDCACTFCNDGAEALAAIGADELDVVVSDIVMPHHDGYEVFAAAKHRSASLPVVLVTGFGYDPDHTVVRACDQGCEEVLYKPFTPQQLVEKVASAIRTAVNGRAGPLVRGRERIEAATMLAPLVPREILCAGRNYGREHAELELFMKPRTAIQHPGRPIRMPSGHAGDPDLACEGELAVVIGRRASRVPENEALDHVFGYLCANDVTARCWRRAGGPQTWMRGKGFDTFCPIGPAIVTRDDVPDPQSLTVTTTVNGEIVRRGGTAEMIRPVARLISEISQLITLEPGTLLLTGAPPLLDSAPAGGLKPGDEVCVEIEGLGRLDNTVEDA